MTPDKFTYWLQGFFELSGSKSLDEQQVQIIKDHLALCFKKETPSYDYLKNPMTCDINGRNKLMDEYYSSQPIIPEVLVTC